MPTTRHCAHVKANGHFCGSPALRGRNYCFYHVNAAGHRLRLQRYASKGLRRPAVELPLLEDAASIQLALMHVTEALLDGSLDHRTAGLVLYSLQTAAGNLRTMQKDDEKDSGKAICSQYDALEQDYELGDCQQLRVEDPEEEEDGNAVVAEAAGNPEAAGNAEVAENQDAPSEADPSAEGNADAQTYDKPAPVPRRPRPIKLNDEDFQMPIKLTEEQFLQAKVAIFQYRLDHNIDANDSVLKVVPRHPAISQKISLDSRKPVSSVSVQEAWQQLEAQSCAP